MPTKTVQVVSCELQKLELPILFTAAEALGGVAEVPRRGASRAIAGGFLERARSVTLSKWQLALDSCS